MSRSRNRQSAAPVAGVAVFLALSLSLTVCSSNAHAGTEEVRDAPPVRDRSAVTPTVDLLRVGFLF